MKVSVCSTIGKTSYNEQDILEFINNSRNILDGKPVETIKSGTLKSKLSPPKLLVKSPNNSFSIENDINIIQEILDSKSLDILNKIDEELRVLLAVIKNDPSKLKSLSLQHLTKWGLDLIDETGNCPLCDFNWESDKLRVHLESKLLKAEEAEKTREQIKLLSERLRNNSLSIINSLANLRRYDTSAKTTSDLAFFENWIEELKSLYQALDDPINNDQILSSGEKSIKEILLQSVGKKHVRQLPTKQWNNLL